MTYPALQELSPRQLSRLNDLLTVRHHIIDVVYNSATDRYEFTCEHPLTERLALTVLADCTVHDTLREYFADPADDPTGRWYARIAPPGHPIAGTWQFMKVNQS